VWQIKSRALRELRMEKVWSIDHLSNVSGVSQRTLVKLEKADRPVRLATLEILAKSLSVSPRAIARPIDEAASPSSLPPLPPPGKLPAPLPPLRAYGPGVTELPRLTRLEELVALEATLPPRPALVTPAGEIPPLTAKVYQDVFTAFLVHEGRVVYVDGTVLAQRGMSREQAKLCGTKNGAGARFHFVFDIAPGHEIGITVHTTSAQMTGTLQKRVNGPGGAVVKVVVAPEEIAEKGGGYEFFMTNAKTLRPWGLEVVEVVAGSGVKGVAKKKAAAKSGKKKVGKGKRGE
jgi:transcriptional regulator with XRE-family HTH domain